MSITIRQIRNATLVLDFSGTKILIDPWLAPKYALQGFPGTHNDHLRNPTAPLNVPIPEIVDVDAVVVTHTHPDHWDTYAVESLPAEIAIYAQNGRDRDLISAGRVQVLDDKGLWFDKVEGKTFSNVAVLTGNPQVKDVKLKKVPGQHGTDEALQAAYDLLNEVSGVVFTAPDEKTLYVAGDTVWNDYVRANIRQYNPDVIVVNAGDAQIPGLGSIIMTPEDVAEVAAFAPNAVIVASHLEAVNHAATTRAELRAHLEKVGLSERVLIPEDGETLTF